MSRHTCFGNTDEGGAAGENQGSYQRGAQHFLLRGAAAFEQSHTAPGPLEVICCLPPLQLCNKQYKTAMELETHLSSYDHHHKKVG